LQKKCAGGYRYDYQGQYSEKDPVTGLNNFELRMYDLMIGRWISKDPAGQFATPYERMGNNPVSGTDPTGGEADWYRDFFGSLVADVGDNEKTLSLYLNIGLGDASNIISNYSNWDFGNSGGISSDGIAGHILSGGLDNLNVLPSPMNVGVASFSQAITGDPLNDSRILNLDPRIQGLVTSFLNDVSGTLGKRLRITQGYRSIAEQDALYAKGRTSDGAVVTNAKGGTSYHNYGLAVDLALINKTVLVNEIIPSDIVNLALKHGFEWGGNFKSIKDYPHFQMTFGMSTLQLRNGD
jgi:RHS repeat-associated protein